MTNNLNYFKNPSQAHPKFKTLIKEDINKVLLSVYSIFLLYGYNDIEKRNLSDTHILLLGI